MKQITQSTSSGFTLAEVMIAIAIFTVGLIAIAALFPTAAILQKRTMESVESRITRNNAMTVLTSMGISSAELNSGNFRMPDALGRVFPMNHYIEASGANIGNSVNYISLDDRSYPTGFIQIDERDFFWVPFMKRESTSSVGGNIVTPARDWTCYVFILKRIPERIYNNSPAANDWPTYPPGYLENANNVKTYGDIANIFDCQLTTSSPISNIPLIRIMKVDVIGDDTFEIDDAVPYYDGKNDSDGDTFGDLVIRGDMVLDEFGNIHQVESATADGFTVAGKIEESPVTGTNPQWVWYVRRADPEDESPLTDIMMINDLVRP